MKFTDKKKKKVLITLTGVVTALVLLIGGNWVLFAQAKEAEAISASQSALQQAFDESNGSTGEDPISNSLPQNEITPPTESNADSSSSGEENSSVNSDITSEDTSDVTSTSDATSDSSSTMKPEARLIGTPVKSGTYGTVPWQIDTTGILSFGGGTFPNNYKLENTPWYTSNTSVTKIVFTEPVEAAVDSQYLFSSLRATSIEGMEYLDTSNTKTMNDMFSNMTNLTSIDLSHFDTSNVTNMTNLFLNCKSLTSLDLSSLDTSNVSVFDGAFSGLTSMTSIDLSPLNTSNPGSRKSMKSMFADSGFTSLDVSTLDVRYVTDITYMFKGLPIQTLDLSAWDTSSVTIAYGAFNSCKNLTSINLSNFNTSNITDMRAMFGNCTSLVNIDVSNFNTSKVTDFTSMFIGCSKLASIDVSNFDTTNALSFETMFSGCSSLTTLDITNFVTFKATNLSGMFQNCSGLQTIDVSKMDTRNVQNFSSMFNGCTGFTSLDVTTFNTKSATDLSRMFGNCIKLPSIDVSGFDTQNVTSMQAMFLGCSSFTNLDVTKFVTSNVTNFSSMFQNCSGLTNIDISNFDTAKATMMSAMFAGCTNMKSLELSHFKTNNVTTMQTMFQNCKNLESLNISGFNTEKVTSMQDMFSGCSALTVLDVSSFNMPKVSNTAGMFQNCTNIKTLDLSGFAPTSLTSAMNMFNGCGIETLDLSLVKLAGTASLTNMLANMPNLYELTLPATFKMSTTGLSDTPKFEKPWTQVGGTTVYANSADFVSKFSADATYTYVREAVWNKTILFDENWNDVVTSLSDEGFPTGTEITLLDETQVNPRTGYTFTGWNTKADGTGDSYAAGATYTVINQNMTFYAQWFAEEQTVKFDGNASNAENVPADIQLPSGSTLDLTAVSAPTRAGYTFAGWFEAKTGGTKLETVTVPGGGATYYAQWIAVNQTIHFEGNAANVSNMPADASAPTDSTFDLSTVGEPTRSGYTFAGWYDAPQNGTKQTQIVVPSQSVTLYAYWLGQDQTISFNGNAENVTNVPDPIVTPSGSELSLADIGSPSRPGYSFVGWYDSPTENAESNKMPESIIVEEGGKTYYAHWAAAPQDIKFNPNTKDTNGTDLLGTPTNMPSNTTSLTGEQVTLSEKLDSEPTLAGYTFGGWYTTADAEGEKVTTFEMPPNEITFYAHWVADSQTISFNFNAPSGINEENIANKQESISSNTGVTVSLKGNVKEPSIEGYTFDGWYTNTSFTTAMPDQVQVPNGGITYYAKWVARETEVLFNGNTKDRDGNSLIGSVTLPTINGNVGKIPGTTNEIIDLSNIDNPILNEGYKFEGWYTDATNSADSYKMPTSIALPFEGVTYYAQWSAVDQPIRFDKNANDATSTQETLYAKTATTVDTSTFSLTDPTRPGYTFKGWYTEPTGGSKLSGTFTMQPGGTTYYAQWSADDQSVIFDGNTVDIDGNTLVGTPTVPDSLSGETDSVISLADVADASLPGYTFQGWYTTNDGPTKMPSSVTIKDGGVTYYALWKADAKQITFDLQATDATTQQTTIDTFTGVNVDLTNVKDATRPGYEFNGWYTTKDGTEKMPSTVQVPDSGVTYYAQWVAVDSFIIFSAGSATNVTLPDPSTITAKTGETVDLTNISDPQRPGYQFLGWFDAETDGNAMPKEKIAMPGGTTTYYAQWKALGQSVYFDANGENVSGMPDTINATTGTTVDLSNISEPSRIGYQFDGWYTSEDGTEKMPSSYVMQANGTTYYAHWIANNYSVKFNAPDATSGTMADQTFEYDAEQALSANEFERTGYTFNSWEATIDGETVSFQDSALAKNLTAEQNGVINLTANWTANSYSIVFDGNGATSGSMEPQTMVYDTPANLNNGLFEKTNYTFEGWNTKADGSGTSYTNGQEVNNLVSEAEGNITLYAQWGDTYSITASDFIVDKSQVENGFNADDDNLKYAAGATAVTNGEGETAAVNVIENEIIPVAGTYKVTFESNGETVTVKATVKDADNILVRDSEAIQANNIGIKSTDVAGLNNDPLQYVGLASAKAWKTDFTNENVEITKVDASRVKALAGSYEIYYSTQAGTTVKAYVAVTDGDNGKVEYSEAIQANNFTVKLSEAPSLVSDDYVQKANAKAWLVAAISQNELGVVADFSQVDTGSIGTYIVTYKTTTEIQTAVTGLVTIYDDNAHITTDPKNNEAIQANDFAIDAKDIAALNLQGAAGYIANANAIAWSMDGNNSPIDVTKADYSEVKAEKGVYPVVYSTEKGTSTTAYVSVGDGDVVTGNISTKEMIQANNFIVKASEVEAGINPDTYIQKGLATAWSWDENGTVSSITTIAVNDDAVLPEKGTYPLTYSLESGVSVTVMVTVQSADNITVDPNNGDAIQANDFTVRKYEVDGLTEQDYKDLSSVVAWTTDGTNSNVSITEVDFSEKVAEVGKYPVTFTTENGTTVKIMVNVIANNVTPVTFDGNGATTEASPKVIGVEEPATVISSLPTTEPLRIGFTFINWNTKADGSGDEFTVGSTVTEAMTVYAQWERNEYVLSFDTQGGGTNPSSQTIPYAYLAQKPDSPSKRGHSFIGWFTAPSGGSYWNFSSTTMPASNTTLYAHYEANKYLVTYDLNGGSGIQYDKVAYNTPIPKPTDPTLYGYTFTGWVDENGDLWDFSTLMQDKDIVLKATWEHTEYHVTYVTYDLKTTLASYTLYAGDQVPPQEAPYVGGHHFASWVEAGTDNKWFTYNTMPDRNIILVATYDKNQEVLPPNPDTTSTTSRTTTNTSTAATTSGSNATVADTSSGSDVSVTSTTSDQSISNSTVTSKTNSTPESTTSLDSSSTPTTVNPSAESWSLISLLLTIVGTILSIILLVYGFKAGNKMIFGIIGAVIGLIAIVLFFILNQLSGTMELFNSKTIIFVATVILQLVMFLLAKGKKSNTDDDEDEIEA